MRKISVFVMVIVAIGMVVTSCGKSVNTNVSLKSDVDSAFYAHGVLQGSAFREGLKTVPGTDGNVNEDAFMAGLVTAMNDDVSKLKMTPDNAQLFLQMYYEIASRKDFEAARAEGEAFLAANKTKEGVITTESGLQYKVITEGTGRRPVETDVVNVHYTGKYLNGEVFESSVERGMPATFGVTQVIGGWVEGLQIMPAGSKYIFWIPSDLAYGEQGNQLIRPNTTLEFELELLSIEGEE